MLITRNGIIIRVDVNKISTIGRNTQGVKLISLDKDDHVIDLTLCEKDTGENITQETDIEIIQEAIPEEIKAEEAQESFNNPDEENLQEEQPDDESEPIE